MVLQAFLITLVFFSVFAPLCFVWSKMHYSEKEINLIVAISTGTIYSFLVFLASFFLLSLIKFLYYLIWG
jgi:hypothetical protein